MSTKEKLKVRGGYQLNGLFIPDSTVEPDLSQISAIQLAAKMVEVFLHSNNEQEFNRYLNRYLSKELGLSEERIETLAAAMNRSLINRLRGAE